MAHYNIKTAFRNIFDELAIRLSVVRDCIAGKRKSFWAPEHKPVRTHCRTRASVGYQANLEKVNQSVRQHQMTAIVGYAGCGKSALAASFVTQQPASSFFWGGIYQINLDNSSGWSNRKIYDKLEEVLAFYQQRLAEWPTPEEDKVQRVQSAWWYVAQEAINLLVVIDNLEDFEDIRPYLPPPEWGIRFLFTSRENLPPPVNNIEIGPLSDEDSLSLLRCRLKNVLQHDNRLAYQDKEGMEALLPTFVRQMEGHPYALDLVAWSGLTHRYDFPLQVAAEEFEKSGTDSLGRLISRRKPSDCPTIRELLSTSWIRLGEQEQLLMSALSLLPVQMLPSTVVREFAKNFSEKGRDSLSGCLHHRIMQYDSVASQYRFYPLFRDFAMRRIEDLSAERKGYFIERFRRSVTGIFLESTVIAQCVAEQDQRSKATILVTAIRMAKELADGVSSDFIPEAQDNQLADEKPKPRKKWQTLLPEWYSSYHSFL